MEREETMSKKESLWVGAQVRVAQEARLQEHTHPGCGICVGDAVDVHLGEVDLRK